MMRIRRFCIVLILLIIVCVRGTVARAAGGNRTVAVMSHTGGLDADARALTRGVTLIVGYKLEAAATLLPLSEGELAAAGTAVDPAKIWKQDKAHCRKAAAALNAQALVVGRVRKDKNGMRAEFRVASVSGKSVGFKKIIKTMKGNGAREFQRGLAKSVADAVSNGAGKAAGAAPVTSSAEALRKFCSGADLLERDRIADGFKALDTAARADRNFRDLDYFLGRWYATQRFDYEKAISHLNRITGAHPDDSGAHFWLGYTYYLKNALSQSIAAFEKAVRIKPFLPDAYMYLAFIFKDSGDFEKTESYYKKALHYTPGNVVLWYNLAGIQALMGKTGPAVASLREVFRRDCKTFLTIARNDADFAKIRKKQEFQNLIKEYADKCGK